MFSAVHACWHAGNTETHKRLFNNNNNNNNYRSDQLSREDNKCVEAGVSKKEKVVQVEKILIAD